NEKMLKIRNLSHFYQEKQVFSISNWEIHEGESWLILGKSGSGKSTLLHILAGLLSPTQGQIFFHETELTQLKGEKLDLFRAKNIGFVFQKSHLVQTLSVLDNLLLVPFLAKEKASKEKAENLLSKLNILHKKKDLPKNLSQGEQQRTSIARALMLSPKLILADEPTASLDDENAHEVIALFKQISQELNATLLIATHDQRIKNQFSNIFQM
ncbi:MAG: ABC transporter ATP-binding protein, partial [Raineya sp.]